jgi:hypothetical protein
MLWYPKTDATLNLTNMRTMLQGVTRGKRRLFLFERQYSAFITEPRIPTHCSNGTLLALSTLPQVKISEAF